MFILLVAVIFIELIIIAILFLNSRRDINFIYKIQNEIPKLTQETNAGINSLSNSVVTKMTEISILQKNQLDTFSNNLKTLTEINEKKLEEVKNTVDSHLKNLQEDTSSKLEKMRETVDDKLNSTLEKRLGESFKLVSSQLESVYKGLGEMQSLASNVGDLKRVLSNVKTRGTWGEIQLEALLEHLLVPSQYGKNIETKKGSNEKVEFAIKLPGKGIEVIWLPIDAKFPQEDYERLLDFLDKGLLEEVEKSFKQLESRIKLEARNISEKYLDPPNTTDFAIMFLPTEGLYAEVIRRPGLCEQIQRDYRIIISGPTTLAAILNSLYMGFRAIAIEKRTSEVWQILSAIKTEFYKFGEILDKTHKKLQEASTTIENAAKKTRTIQRKLKGVEEVTNDDKIDIIHENLLETEETEETHEFENI